MDISQENEIKIDELRDVLRQHNDDSCDFFDCCHFFCDAVRAMAYRTEEWDYSTAEGITLFTWWMKRKLTSIKKSASKASELARPQE